MATIHKRTIFFEIDKNGNHIPCDFARVITNIGTCLEPRTEFFARKSNGVGFADFDPTDEMSMITGIEGISMDRVKFILGDGVNGGYCCPRSGR